MGAIDDLRQKDLGLTYEQAAHGVQTAIAFGIKTRRDQGRASDPKHLRVGIDMEKSDMRGLACLLIDKGIVTLDEYIEAMRLAANAELQEREEDVRADGFTTMSFR